MSIVVRRIVVRRVRRRACQCLSREDRLARTTRPHHYILHTRIYHLSFYHSNNNNYFYNNNNNLKQLKSYLLPSNLVRIGKTSCYYYPTMTSCISALLTPLYKECETIQRFFHFVEYIMSWTTMSRRSSILLFHLFCHIFIF